MDAPSQNPDETMDEDITKNNKYICASISSLVARGKHTEEEFFKHDLNVNDAIMATLMKNPAAHAVCTYDSDVSCHAARANMELCDLMRLVEVTPQFRRKMVSDDIVLPDSQQLWNIVKSVYMNTTIYGPYRTLIDPAFVHKLHVITKVKKVVEHVSIADDVRAYTAARAALLVCVGVHIVLINAYVKIVLSCQGTSDLERERMGNARDAAARCFGRCIKLREDMRNSLSSAQFKLLGPVEGRRRQASNYIIVESDLQ